MVDKLDMDQASQLLERRSTSKSGPHAGDEIVDELT